MNIYTIDTGFFKLDGGAMFGVVPKSMWNKLNPADSNNMCNWAMRCLLVESGDRLVLIDNGIGDKQDAKFFSYYYLNGDQTLDKSLKSHGFSRDDITDVFLTHLHFDHCGGSVRWNSKKDGFELCFPNATYWSNENHWKWATQPNAREKASFLKENILPIQESGHLQFLKPGEDLFEGFRVHLVNGHTESMMLPILNYKNNKVVFCADLIPSAAHVPLPYVMAYDTRPLLTLEEKAPFLKMAVDENYTLFFEHDPLNECGILEYTDRGIKLKATFKLEEI
ncbi:MAG: MBL fold metallo-hydrolase [Bacteroidetes bacterium]|nr:MAG: MBL fold metallo-hydrolase [Bacteroidota bacterium]